MDPAAEKTERSGETAKGRSSNARRVLRGPKGMIEVTSGGASYVVDAEQYRKLVQGTIDVLADEGWPAKKSSVG